MKFVLFLLISIFSFTIHATANEGPDNSVEADQAVESTSQNTQRRFYSGSFISKGSPLQEKVITFSADDPLVILYGEVKPKTATLRVSLSSERFFDSSCDCNNRMYTNDSRCDCVENTFAKMTQQQRNEFWIHVRIDWLKTHLGEVFEDSNVLAREWAREGSLALISGRTQVIYSPSDRKIARITLVDGVVNKAQFNRRTEAGSPLNNIRGFNIDPAAAAEAAETANSSNESADPTQGKDVIHKFDLHNDNPAALRFIEEAEDGWKILHLQIVNKQLMLARCICPMTSIHGAINEARGNFTVKVSQAWFDKSMSHISNESLADNWQNNQMINIITGTILATSIENRELEAYLANGQVQEGTYTYTREDAFEFDGILGASEEEEGEGSSSSFFDGLNLEE